jgi:hypothetical protein
MACRRCDSDANVEKHHIVHKINGGTDFDNIVELCRSCHKYQHTKERLLDSIRDYAAQLRGISITKSQVSEVANKISNNIHRLTVNEDYNTPDQIKERGYYSYWNNKLTHYGSGFKFKKG